MKKILIMLSITILAISILVVVYMFTMNNARKAMIEQTDSSEDSSIEEDQQILNEAYPDETIDLSTGDKSETNLGDGDMWTEYTYDPAGYGWSVLINQRTGEIRVTHYEAGEEVK